ncbi:MAG: diaminopimelate epimerase [Rickettsiales bacterium]|nr:diaminopimelate epimerase [Rickettsiales bacterium]
MIPFTKMNGCKNEYIFVDCFHNQIENPAELARAVSSRQPGGVGSDGLILVCPSDVADVKMRIFNSDGSEAEMCGNGSRCVAKFAYENGLTDKKKISLETLAGIKYLEILDNGNVSVNMGRPVVDEENITIGILSGRIVSMGNPHFVIVAPWLDKFDTKELDRLSVARLGPPIENDPIFPNKTNVEFIHILDEKNIKMRVWERGAGETPACGTGACAAVAACVKRGLVGGSVTVRLPGGNLDIYWPGCQDIIMNGDAVEMHKGQYYFPKKQR